MNKKAEFKARLQDAPWIRLRDIADELDKSPSDELQREAWTILAQSSIALCTFKSLGIPLVEHNSRIAPWPGALTAQPSEFWRSVAEAMRDE